MYITFGACVQEAKERATVVPSLIPFSEGWEGKLTALTGAAFTGRGMLNQDPPTSGAAAAGATDPSSSSQPPPPPQQPGPQADIETLSFTVEGPEGWRGSGRVETLDVRPHANIPRDGWGAFRTLIFVEKTNSIYS